MNVELTAAQRRALRRIAPVLHSIVQMDVNSYTNLIGPHVGSITDAPTLKELAAIEAFCVAFGIEFEPWRDLCRAEVARFAATSRPTTRARERAS